MAHRLIAVRRQESELASQAELLVAVSGDDVVGALRLYTTLGFKRDRDLDPIDGVVYGRHVLPADRLPAALERLANRQR